MAGVCVKVVGGFPGNLPTAGVCVQFVGELLGKPTSCECLQHIGLCLILRIFYGGSDDLRKYLIVTFQWSTNELELLQSSIIEQF